MCDRAVATAYGDGEGGVEVDEQRAERCHVARVNGLLRPNFFVIMADPPARQPTSGVHRSWSFGHFDAAFDGDLSWGNTTSNRFGQVMGKK